MHVGGCAQAARRYAAEQLVSNDPAGAHQLGGGVVGSAPWGNFDALVATYVARLAAVAASRAEIDVDPVC
jgi:hypothetical protein